MLNLNRIITYKIQIILFFLFICSGLYAENITNPLFSYNKIQDKLKVNMVDSVLSSKLDFKNLPEYGTTTNLTLTYFAPFSTKNDLVIKVLGKSIEKKEIAFEQYSFTISGPIIKGEAYTAGFNIKPLKTGKLKFYFVVIDNNNSLSDRQNAIRTFKGINVVIILDANGKTIFLSSEDSYVHNDIILGILGPEPSLFSKSLYFAKNPIVDDSAYDYSNKMLIDYYSKMFPFSTYYEVIPSQDQKGLFHVKCKLLSFYNFENGIGFDVSCTDNLEIFNISCSINEQVYTDKYYFFSFDFKVNSPGITTLAIKFSTPNTGEYKSFKNIKSYKKKISDGLVLYIGTDNENETQFITDKHPEDLLKYSSEKIDHRRKLVEFYDLSKRMRTFKGENYNDIFSKFQNSEK